MARITHRNDRMHRGLVPTAQLGSGSATSSTVLRGDQTWGTAPGTSFGSNATEVGNASAGGASSSNSRADHVHKGVHSITAAGSNNLYGDVNVAAGSGIAVTQSGQTVTVASSVSAVVSLDDLSDVTISSPTTADRLRYNGSGWVNSALVWRPAMVLDPTSGNYLPVVTGDGDAVMTEA